VETFERLERLPDSREHIPQLDGIRGLAILMVLVHHFTEDRSRLTGWVRHVFLAADAGWVGVDLFFVLSGYLITRILLSTKDSPRYFRVFYGRRALRIFPLYYAVLAAALLVLPRFVVRTPAYDALLNRQVFLWTYLSNWVADTFNCEYVALKHFWSLSVEEQFYLVWPALIYFTSKRQARILCWVAIAGAPLVRLALAASGHAFAGYFVTPGRADALSLGALVAIEGAGRLMPLARRAAPFLASAMAVLTMAGAWKVAIENDLTPSAMAAKSIGLSLVSFSAAALLVLVLSPETPGWVTSPFRSRTLRWIGQISYGIYVFHYLLQPALQRLVPAAMLRSALGSDLAAVVATLVVGSVVSIAAAALSWHLFEKRILRLKRHLSYGDGPGGGL
jgi:peptidoglycan/LPS O-acetylase OafA/YrhL